MQFLLWSTNKWWLKYKFDLHSSWNCQCLRMDCKQTKRDEHLQCRAHRALFGTDEWWQKRCWLLLLHPPVPQHPTLAAAHHASEKRNGLSPGAMGSTWFITLCLSTRLFVSREERMLSGDGQHRLGIYHLTSLHCNTGYTCRGQFLLSTKQMTSGNYIRTSI